MQLNGKTALVTGAAQGLGRAICLRFAALGSDIVCADLDVAGAAATADAVRTIGRSALSLAVDVADIDQVTSMVDAAVRKMGAVDVLVACAGVTQAKNALEITEEDWDRIFSVNAKGTFFTDQAVIKHMCERGAGAVVNIASIAGRGPRPDWIAYAASKAAVISVTRSMAAAVGCYGITVNAICPGVIATQMWESLGRETAATSGGSARDAIRMAASRSCLLREETPEDVANAAAFLASAESSYITGQAINVDGGIEMD